MYHNRESTLEYKERLIRLMDLNTAAKGPAIPEELAAAIYFNGLDSRYLSFQQGIQNYGIFNADGVKAVFPTTIEQIYNLSNTFKVVATNAQHQQVVNGSDINGSVFQVGGGKRKGGGKPKADAKVSTDAAVDSNTKANTKEKSHLRNAKGELISKRNNKIICHGCGENHYTDDCPDVTTSVNKVTKDMVGGVKFKNAYVIQLSVFSEYDENRTPDYDVQLLDTGCAHDLQMTNNLTFVSNLREFTPAIEVGVGGKVVHINQMGDSHHFGSVLYSDQLPFTIWSYDKVTDYCECDLIDMKTFRVTLSDHTFMDFNCDKDFNGILTHHSDSSSTASVHSVYVQSVNNNMVGFTNTELKAAKLVQDFIQQQSYISYKNLVSIIKHGTWLNLPFTLKDVENSMFIYGPSIPALKGKSKKTAQPIIPIEEISRSRLVSTNVDLLLDFMFINKIPFLIGLGVPVNFAFTYHASGGRGRSSINYLFNSLMSFWKANSFNVARVRMDLEGGLSPLIPTIQNLGVKVEQASPGDHVPQVERLIQTIKGTIRSLQASVPVVWPKIVLIRAVCVAVRCFNLVPSSVMPDQEVPYTRVLGLKPDYRRDSRLSFLQPCEAMVPISDNSMDQRTQTVFNVGPVDGSRTGAYRMLNPLTGRVIFRSQFTPVPLSSYHVSLLKQMVMREKSSTGTDYEFRRGNLSNSALDFLHDADTSPIIEHHPEEYRPRHEIRGVLPEVSDDFHTLPDDNPSLSHQSYHDLQSLEIPDNTIAPTMVSDFDPSIGGGIDADLESPALNSNAISMESNIEVNQINDAGANYDDNNDEYNNNNNYSSSSNVAESSPLLADLNNIPRNLQHSLDGKEWQTSSSKRERKPRQLTNIHAFALFHYSGGQKMTHNYLLQGDVYRITQTPKQAIKSRGTVAMDALVKEIIQLASKGTFEPVFIRNLSPDQRERIIPSFTFMEDKYDPTTRAYIKTKARCVAGGHRQNRSLYESTWSPTVSSPAIFIVAGIAAMEGREVYVLDVPTAYPNAKKDTEGPQTVFVVLSQLEAAILIKYIPDYAAYLREDGTIVVRLARALYGLIESAKLWYEELTNTLRDSGFVPNEYDPCVLNKSKNGSQITICLHVDDMMITSTDESLVRELHNVLQIKYGKMEIKSGKIHSFLGMSFDFSTDRKVSIRMGKFIDEVLLKGNVQGLAETPAGDNLFSVDASLPILPKKDQEHIHSMTAMLLYLAKKVRPELLTLVGYLTRRVNKFNSDDMKKLNRGLKYLAATKDLDFTLCFDKEMKITSSVDASYATSHDYKSVSGATTTLGGAIIHAQSKVQNLITKSSFEAELVATSDYAGRPIWVREFLIDQGYQVGPATIEQDNQGTMIAIKRGSPPSDRSRHINIRFFWVADRILKNEVTLAYVPTEFMLADILTKPLQGERFTSLRDRLLGLGGASGSAYMVCRR
jgi:hypothetical protein